MATLQVTVIDTAADADALAGTDLATTPGPGLLQIWSASTVNTATLTLTVGEVNICRSIALPLRASGLPDLSADPPVAQLAVGGGESPKVNIGGTTGTCYTIARWTPASEV